MQVETIKSAVPPPLAKPKMIVSDHGTKLTSNAILGWTKDHVQPSPVVPEDSIRRDWRGEAESAHHPMLCLRSSTCSQPS
jgi:hypothetical protein